MNYEQLQEPLLHTSLFDTICFGEKMTFNLIFKYCYPLLRISC